MTTGEKAAYDREYRRQHPRVRDDDTRAYERKLYRLKKDDPAKYQSYLASMREYQDKNRAALREKNRLRMRSAQYKYKFGISRDVILTKLAAQGGACKLCGRSLREGDGVIPHKDIFHVDHNHARIKGEAGFLRDILCFGCNGGLGMFRDNPSLMRAAAAYVEFHNAIGRN